MPETATTAHVHSRGPSVRATVEQVIAVGRARWYFRHATERGARLRVWGRPRIVNEGRMLIASRVRIRSIVATTELVAHAGGTLQIGESSFVNFGTSIAATERITIGRDCHIGPHCLVMDNAYHRLEPERRSETPPSEPISIGDNVWIGAKVVVLPGTTIGEGSVIGAGSVVSGEVPPRSLAAGVPCRVIRQL